MNNVELPYTEEDSASTASTAPSTAECANKQQQAGILANHSNIHSLVWVIVLVHRRTSPSPSQQAAPSYQVYQDRQSDCHSD